MEKNPKKKGFLKRIILGIFKSPLTRGIIKSLPFGNIVYEVGNNISHSLNEEKRDTSKPHSAISILAQIVFLSLIVYAFYTKQISIETILQMIGMDDFKDDLLPFQNTNIIDTLK